MLRFLVKQNALQLSCFCIVFLLFHRQDLSRISGNSEQKSTLQTFEQLIQFSYGVVTI